MRTIYITRRERFNAAHQLWNHNWDAQKNYDVFEITDFSKENLIKELKEVDAVALRTASLYEDVLMYCPKIKIISRHGVGYNNVDLDYLDTLYRTKLKFGTKDEILIRFK